MEELGTELYLLKRQDLISRVYKQKLLQRDFNIFLNIDVHTSMYMCMVVLPSLEMNKAISFKEV